MKIIANHRLNLSVAGCAASLLWAIAGPAAAQQPHSATKGASTYSQQRQACVEGMTSENRKTCLREAAAARQAARSGKLYKGQQQDYTKNALRRCDALPQADRDECVARMTNPTDTSGSVAGGGILYEYREIVLAGTPGSTVIPRNSAAPGAAAPPAVVVVDPAVIVTPGGKMVPGVVVEELPANTMKPAR